MTPEEELARANECGQILGNRYVREALDGIRSALIEHWEKTPLKESELRERIWAIYCAASKFEELLKSYIETGKLAAVQAEQKRSSLGDRVSSMFRGNQERW